MTLQPPQFGAVLHFSSHCFIIGMRRSRSPIVLLHCVSPDELGRNAVELADEFSPRGISVADDVDADDKGVQRQETTSLHSQRFLRPYGWQERRVMAEWKGSEP